MIRAVCVKKFVIMKILFIGDIVGKIGRRGVTAVLPHWRKKYAPDFVIANAENLSHGVGFTAKTLQEMLDAGVDAFTGGNHSFRAEGAALLDENRFPVIRPANYPPGLPGKGEMVLVDKKHGKFSILVLNLIGRVFFKEQCDDPFRALDGLLARHADKQYAAILVDFHADASSEKNAFGFFADGKVSAVVGTHTHIGTVDARLLPKGTAYVSDVGGVIAVDSVLGENKEGIVQSFILQQPFQHDPPESGLCRVAAMLIETDETTGKAKKIQRIDEETYIE